MTAPPTLATPLPRVHRALGAWVQDPAGRRYLDLTGGAGALGHRHPAVTDALQEQVGRVTCTGPHLPGDQLPALLDALAGLAPGARPTVAGSAAAALAGAVEVARARRPAGAVQVASSSAAAAALGVAARAFGALAPGPDVAAVVVEAAAGLAPGAWSGLARACARHDTLLILDETRLGLGRCGAVTLAGQPALEGVRPDLVVLGDGLSGGVGALGATLSLRAELALPPPTGAGPLQAAAATAALIALQDPALLSAGRQTAAHLRAALSELPLGGLGAWLEVAPAVPAGTALEALRSRGVLAAPAGPDRLALLPPLVLSAAERDWALAQLSAALR